MIILNIHFSRDLQFTHKIFMEKKIPWVQLYNRWKEGA